MKLFQKAQEKLENDLSFHTLLKIIMILAVIWLLQATGGVWKTVFSYVWTIIQPFFIGFIIAYILHWPIAYAKKHHIPRSLSIPLIYILLAVFIIWILSSFLPDLLNRASSLLGSIINSLDAIKEYAASLTDSGLPAWAGELIQNAIDSLSDMNSLLPGLSTNMPEMLSRMLSYLVTILFTIAVSVFMNFGWDKIRSGVSRAALSVSEKFNACLFAVNGEIASYLRSMLILIAIRFVEYAAVYLIAGHPEWLLLAVCTAFAVIIPYIAPTIVNIVGILTALSLAPPRVILLAALIIILSFVDGYVIEPLVHSHNTAVTPLWALFSIFAGSTLLGVWGVIIAVPVYLSVHKILQYYGPSASGAEK